MKTLGTMEMALLVSFDSAHRTPLFYAVAYNHVDVTKYLLTAGALLSISKGEWERSAARRYKENRRE